MTTDRRILNLPQTDRDLARSRWRRMVILSKVFGQDDETIYRQGASLLVEEGRLLGLDELDIEEAVSQYRRDVASILADINSNGFDPSDLKDSPDGPADVAAS